MVTKVVLLLAALVTLGMASKCPIYTCDSTLGTNVCATWTGVQQFKLNSNGCQSNYYCVGSVVNTWAILKGSAAVASDSTSSCLLTPTVTVSNVTVTVPVWTAAACITKLPNKNFKNNSTAVTTCLVDTDCPLWDGTNAYCSCASFRTDGAGVCVPSSSNDQVFSAYWTACGTSNSISSQNAYYYLSNLLSYWVIQQSTATCISLFSEAKTATTLLNAYNGSGALAVGVFGLAALFY